MIKNINLKKYKLKILSKQVGTPKIIPGFGLSLGIVITMLSILVLIPLLSILVYSFKFTFTDFFKLITTRAVLQGLITSITTSFIAALINCVFGIILAWVLVKYEFFGKRLLDGILELPFTLPTAVAGITLSKLYSNTGMLGKSLEKIGIKVAYSQLGIIVALVFVGIPFVVRSIQPVLEKLDKQYEEAAYVFGSGPIRTFFQIIFAEIRPALLTGFSLAFARGIGEYGSVIYISGNSLKNKTQVISYVIMQKLNYVDYASATAIALVMLIFAFLVLLVVNIIQVKQSFRTNNT